MRIVLNHTKRLSPCHEWLQNMLFENLIFLVLLPELISVIILISLKLSFVNLANLRCRDSSANTVLTPEIHQCVVEVRYEPTDVLDFLGANEFTDPI